MSRRKPSAQAQRLISVNAFLDQPRAENQPEFLCPCPCGGEWERRPAIDPLAWKCLGCGEVDYDVCF